MSQINADENKELIFIAGFLICANLRHLRITCLAFLSFPAPPLGIPVMPSLR
jgi:hypothetical protein